MKQVSLHCYQNYLCVYDARRFFFPGLPELLVMIENLYKHTLETLLKKNSDDVQYFHNELCSDDTKVLSALQVCVCILSKLYTYSYKKCRCVYTVSSQFLISPARLLY